MKDIGQLEIQFKGTLKKEKTYPRESYFNGAYYGYKVKIKLVRENLGLYQPKKITGPSAVFEFLKSLQDLDREKFFTILLDTKNQIIGVEEVSVGISNSSLVHPREVLKAAILSSATSVIFVHNHPSGDPMPSQEDKDLTSRLISACEIIGLQVLDHIIIGYGKYLSFADESLLRSKDRAI